MKHYSAAELDQYRHDDMSIVKKALCCVHLKICKDCQQKLEDLQDDDKLLQEQRSARQIYKDLDYNGSQN